MRGIVIAVCWVGCAGRQNSSVAATTTLRDLEEHTARHPDDPDGLIRLGLEFERLGDRRRAQQYFAAAARAGASANDVSPALMRVSLALDDYEAAIRYGRLSEEGLASDCPRGVPRSCALLTQVRVMLGELYMVIGDREASRELFHAALEVDSRQVDAYLGLARLEVEHFQDLAAGREALERGLSTIGQDARAGELRAALKRHPGVVR